MAPPGRIANRLDTLVLAGCLTLAVVTRALPDSLKQPIAGALRRTVVAPLAALQRDAELSRRAWLDRGETVRIRDSVALRSMALEPLERENEQLRKLLALGEKLRWGFVPAEVLRGRRVAENYTMTLTAGANAGIVPFSPLVAPDGLLGMVKTVDPTLSIAILWSHPDFRVSAQSADGHTFGIVAAHLDDSEGRNLLELRGVPLRSSLEPGTEIWSSGAGNVYPKGIPIGTVIGEVKQPAEVWARTYILKPAVNPASVDAVMILQPERGDSLPGVWQTRAQADSISRSVVAAAESLARKVAADSLAAKRRRDSVARADSIRRATPPLSDSTSPPALPQRDSLPRPGAR